jgi:Xaa-Pro aminopeptidase
MAEASLDAVLITSEANFRYLSGFASQTWVSPTRPRYLIMPRDSEPIAVVPASNVTGIRESTPITDVRSWKAPNPSDDGISLLLTILKENVGDFGAVGAELGHESRLGMPAGDFLRICEVVRPIEIRDAAPLIARVRMVKSHLEVARIRHIGSIASACFQELPELVNSCTTVRDFCRQLEAKLILRGADKTPYLVGEAGNGGYETIMMGPNDHRLREGDILFIDTGSQYDGYFCDFDRNFAIGNPADPVLRAYDAAYEATEAGLNSVRPGRTASDIWHAMSSALGPNNFNSTYVGRMGHGLGLSLTEPPSIHPRDETVLEPGMVITLEPSLTYLWPSALSGTTKIMVHEEDVVVTENGCELLTARAPSQIPVLKVRAA